MSRRFVPRAGALAAAASIVLAAGAAHAEDGAGGGPRVFSIQPRPFRLGHEFQLGAGVLPMDAFYIGAVAAASYTYHFTDFWAWEIASVGYSLNIDTPLKDDLRRDYSVQPVDNGGDRIHYYAMTSLVVKPLFGKLAIFNRDVVSSETFFVLGVGTLELGRFPRPAVDVGLGLRFWSSQTLSLRFDMREILIFKTAVPRQSLFVVLSAAFNFVNGPPHPEQAEAKK
jgi:outer membrane beta-barrel protein